MSTTTDDITDFPVAGLVTDGWSKSDEASATCFCGAVQLAFPTKGPGVTDSFVCHCSDCHKLTVSVFASNFTVVDSYLKHLRGQSNLKTFSQSTSVASGNTMTNFSCDTCGSLMYRVSSGLPGQSILRIGTIDDFAVIDTKLRPRREQFTKQRASWLKGLEGVKATEGNGEYSQEVFE